MVILKSIDHWARVATGRKEKKSRWRTLSRTSGFLLAGAGLGAGVMYYVDPERGRRRRNVSADRAMAVIRKTSRRVMRAERRAAAQVTGKATGLRHFRDQPDDVANDQMLTDRIQSQAFRDFDFPHGHVNINVEERVAVLHGVLEEPDHIEQVEQAVRKTPGVDRVESYLHLPNTPAPEEGARHNQSTLRDKSAHPQHA